MTVKLRSFRQWPISVHDAETIGMNTKGRQMYCIPINHVRQPIK